MKWNRTKLKALSGNWELKPTRKQIDSFAVFPFISMFISLGSVNFVENVWISLIALFISIPALCFYLFIKNKIVDNYKNFFLYTGLYFIELAIVGLYVSYFIVVKYFDMYVLDFIIYLFISATISLSIITIIKNRITSGYFIKELKPKPINKAIVTVGALLGIALSGFLSKRISEEDRGLLIRIVIGVFGLFGFVGIYYIFKYYCYNLLNKKTK